MHWSWWGEGGWRGLSSPDFSSVFYFKITLKSLYGLMVLNSEGRKEFRGEICFSFPHSWWQPPRCPLRGSPLSPVPHVPSRDSHTDTSMIAYGSFLAWSTPGLLIPLRLPPCHSCHLTVGPWVSLFTLLHSALWWRAASQTLVRVPREGSGRASKRKKLDLSFSRDYQPQVTHSWQEPAL